MAGRPLKERSEEQCICRRMSNFGLSCWQNTHLVWTKILTLRQQISVLRRTAPKRLSFSVFDRLVFVGLYQLFPEICDALTIVKPDTIVGWHRAGFRLYWRWKSSRRGGRPKVPVEIRRLIREMSIANP